MIKKTISMISAAMILMSGTFSFSTAAVSEVTSENSGYTLSQPQADSSFVPSNVSGAKAEKTTANSISLTWDKSFDAQGYILYQYNEADKTWVKINVTTANSYTVKKLNANSTYKFGISAYNNFDGIEYISESMTELSAQTRPYDVSGFSAVSTTNSSVKLTWDKVDGVTGYIVYRQVNGKFTAVKKTESSEFLDTKLSSGTLYKYAVKAYSNINGNTAISTSYPTVTAATKLNTVTGFKTKSRKINSITLSWNKVNNASGYILYQQKSGKWKRIAIPTTNSYTVSDLSSTTTYKFAVKAYTKLNGSTITSVSYPNVLTCTLPAKVTSFKTSAVSASAVKLTWKKISGANGYIVYKYDASKKKWIRATKTATNVNTYTVTKLSPSTSYKFAVKAYKTVNEKEVTGTAYPTLTAKTKANIVTKNGITYVNGVLVANKTYSLPASYDPGGLTTATQAAFSKMQRAAANDNISLWVSSGYRSYSYQAWLYNSYVARDGKWAADRYSARPGHSEHQTGLAIDVNNPSSSFNNTPAAKWIAKHCAEYGFILRYPQGKESVTGYLYESWHVRYVGVDLAKKITASGLTLEEYFGITSKYK